MLYTDTQIILDVPQGEAAAFAEAPNPVGEKEKKRTRKPAPVETERPQTPDFLHPPINPGRIVVPPADVGPLTTPCPMLCRQK